MCFELLRAEEGGFLHEFRLVPRAIPGLDGVGKGGQEDSAVLVPS